jgi:hypothetical protein
MESNNPQTKKYRTTSGNDDAESVIDACIESFQYELEEIVKDNDNREIYFHDVIHENVDNHVSTMNRQECLAAIDEIGGEENIDEGMIDRSADLTRQLAQMAYCVIEEELFTSDLMMYLQDELNNENVDKTKAKKILRRIKEDEA